MNIRSLSLFLFMACSTLLAQQPETLLHLPWGNAPNALQKRLAPEALYGPQNFSIQGDTVWVLDTQNNQLKIFLRGRLVQSLSSPVDSRDFIRTAAGKWLFMSGNGIFEKDGQRWKSVYQSRAGELMERLEPVADGFGVNFSRGNNIWVNPAVLKKNTVFQAGGLYDGYLVRLKKNNRSLARAVRTDPKNGLQTEFRVTVPENNLATVQCIGIDDRQRLFLEIELIEREVPLVVKRRVWVFNQNGKQLAAVDLSPFTYAQIGQDIKIDRRGNLYQMMASSDGVDILKWKIGALLKNDSLAYPEKYRRAYHYNRHIYGEAPEHGPALFKTAGDLPAVTPDEALAIADSYVRLSWTCSDANLTHGRIIDPNGAEVETPSWVQLGTNQKMPYRWGGFETIQQFLNGISAGKYAGDRATSAVSSYARGVDCSGFVSRTWKLPTHYSTRMMDDEITQPYDSWEELRPGDAIHIPGHVRLAIANNPNGTIDVAEASGRDWQVSYRTYDYSDLSGYTPRYYINMQGTPLYVPQPILYSVLCPQQTQLQWNPQSAGVFAWRLSRSENGTNWQVDTVLASGRADWRESLSDGTAVYYRMTAMAASDSVTEGLPSDSYGVFRKEARPGVLIVDGFDRISGSWGHSYHAFAVSYGQSLKSLGVPFETVANEAVIDGKVSLGAYRAVIWFLGDESTEDQTFDADEQRLVENYLKNGGRLFVSGSEVAWDLDHKGSAPDQSFFHDFLKAAYEKDDSKSYTVNGATDGPFTGLTLHYDDGSHGVYPEDYPDVIRPVNNGAAALRYANGETAAITYTGLFPGGLREGRLFYMGFPFETIYDASERLDLMTAIMDFLGMDVTGLDVSGTIKTPDQFTLLGNFPNPFNPLTHIRFYLPGAGRVRLRVYNSAGQKVYAHQKLFVSPGPGEIRFNAAHLASGVYLYTVEYRGLLRRGRFVLLK